MKAESTFSLKDRLFNPEKVDHLARLVEAAYPAFPGEAFREEVTSAFPALGLKERITHISEALHHSLPPVYPDALEIILQALPPELDPTRSDGDYGDFIYAPLSLFVAAYGCSAEHLGISLPALREITKRFSAEDAIRFFLNAFPGETISFLHGCATDPNYHVRRLASEGTRPLLPWSQRLALDHRAPLPILELLFSDDTRYVTRSVANHLNDVSKLEPELAVETLRRWRDEGRQTPEETEYITRHALRTLVKKGESGALELLGFAADPDVNVIQLTTNTPRVRVGGAFEFSATLRANGPAKLLVDYIMIFAGGGRPPSRKVFKLKQVELDAGESVTLSKSHPMRLMTTRRLHPGEHRIMLQVNGRRHGSLAFDLLAD